MKNTRLKIIIRGVVQGVGFRPFVFRLAKENSLHGWVMNTAQGVIINVEGPRSQCESFKQQLQSEKPQHAFITSFEVFMLDPKGCQGFKIKESEEGASDTLILPDIAICDDCRREILDSNNRRYRYPFTNCTQCGPRYSIIQDLPYDRKYTTMKDFVMCPECRREYEDPQDRRFHAQPNACPACGPQLKLWNVDGKVIAEREEALEQAVKKILEGKIVALKGLGGFQLIVEACNEEVIERLRQRKHREGKPFAVMMNNLEDVKEFCKVSEKEQQLLISSESPIVLLEQKENNIAQNVSPGNPFLGVMLPYTPLHILLMDELKVPIVATSGNLSEEPMCIDEKEALSRLKGIADFFLVHDRPIERAVDDSVARVILDREMILRRARGYAPLPFVLEQSCRDVLAVGGHLKNTIALSKGKYVFVSQHIGDLETTRSYDAFKTAIDDMKKMYAVDPKIIICDEHPQYMSTRYAQEQGVGIKKIQHHTAHIFSCMADNELMDDVLGVSWDGAGFGLDETIWGGEFISVDKGLVKRVASFRPFPLPGGERAIREPRRASLGFLYARYGKAVFDQNLFGICDEFSDEEKRNLEKMLSNYINSPLTSSAGRLFDVVAGLLNIRQTIQFEGQAAMEVEFAAMQSDINGAYPFNICRSDDNELQWIIDFDVSDWIADDIQKDVAAKDICAKFHHTLVEIIVGVAQKQDKKRIVMSGGCFQNKYLLEWAVKRLREEGRQPYWHQRIPTNDGGISAGQIVAAQQFKR